MSMWSACSAKLVDTNILSINSGGARMSTPSSPKPAAESKDSPKDPRKDLLDRAVRFLQHPKVRDAPHASKVSFLESKGLTPQVGDTILIMCSVLSSIVRVCLGDFDRKSQQQSKKLKNSRSRPHHLQLLAVPSLNTSRAQAIVEHYKHIRWCMASMSIRLTPPPTTPPTI